jgi:hypothetical protein
MKACFNSASRARFHFYWLFRLVTTGGKGLLFALALLAAWPAAGFAAEPEGCSEQRVPPAKSPATASPPTEALKAYVDPETGELLSEPPQGEPEAPDSAASAPEEPQYEAETRPDGTVVLDLSERPLEELRAEVVDGKIVSCHGPGSAPSESSEK